MSDIMNSQRNEQTKDKWITNKTILDARSTILTTFPLDNDTVKFPFSHSR